MLLIAYLYFDITTTIQFYRVEHGRDKQHAKKIIKQAVIDYLKLEIFIASYYRQNSADIKIKSVKIKTSFRGYYSYFNIRERCL